MSFDADSSKQGQGAPAKQSGIITGQLVDPEIREALWAIALRIPRETFAGKSPKEKLEAVLLAADEVLQPEGNYILVNADLPLKNLLGL